MVSTAATRSTRSVVLRSRARSPRAYEPTRFLSDLALPTYSTLPSSPENR